MTQNWRVYLLDDNCKLHCLFIVDTLAISLFLRETKVTYDYLIYTNIICVLMTLFVSILNPQSSRLHNFLRNSVINYVVVFLFSLSRSPLTRSVSSYKDGNDLSPLQPFKFFCFAFVFSCQFVYWDIRKHQNISMTKYASPNKFAIIKLAAMLPQSIESYYQVKCRRGVEIEK